MTANKTMDKLLDEWALDRDGKILLSKPRHPDPKNFTLEEFEHACDDTMTVYWVRYQAGNGVYGTNPTTKILDRHLQEEIKRLRTLPTEEHAKVMASAWIEMIRINNNYRKKMGLGPMGPY